MYVISSKLASNAFRKNENFFHYISKLFYLMLSTHDRLSFFQFQYNWDVKLYGPTYLS